MSIPTINRFRYISSTYIPHFMKIIEIVGHICDKIVELHICKVKVKKNRLTSLFQVAVNICIIALRRQTLTISYIYSFQHINNI